MHRRRPLAFALVALAASGLAAPALAEQPPAPADAPAPMPDPVRAMIDDVLANGSDAEIAAIIRFARRAYPAEGEALDQRLAERSAARAAQRAAEVAAAGPLDNWRGRAEVGATLNTGSVDNFGLYGSLEARREGVRWTHQLRARAAVQDSNGVRTQEQLLAAYEPRFTVDDRLSSYALLQAERDPFVGFDARLSASLGLGYALVRSTDLTLNVQGGPAYRYEKTTVGDDQSIIAGRAAFDARLRLGSGVQLTQTASAFVDTQGSSFVSATGLEAQLAGRLSARLSYNVQHEDRPATDLLKTDTQSRVSLVYGF